MSTACWDGAQVPPGHQVFGHQRRFLGLFGAWKTGGTRWRLGAGEASGGLYLSAPELAKLAILELGEGDGPVSRASLRESQTPTTPAGPGFQGTGYGLSMLQVNGVGPVLFKNGGLANWSSSLLLDPERRLGVVLLLAGETDATDLAAADLLRAAIAATPSPPSSRTTSAGPRTGSASP
jgi:CubicO group peptidase (beta-lactamase class C family)